MRYWIFWNDLVQGPFEIDELRALKAFTADLSVCEEDQQDWVPAAAVSELLPYLQPVSVVTMEGLPSSGPPPPPPSSPPGGGPLQGEFFHESSGQQQLFDPNGSKHYFFRAADETPAGPTQTLAGYVSPFRFFVEVAPVPRPFSPPPIEYPPLPEEFGLGVVEPEELHEPAPIEKPPVQPPVVQPPVVQPPVVQAPPVPKPIILPLRVEIPRVETPPPQPKIVKPPPKIEAPPPKKQEPPRILKPVELPVVEKPAAAEPVAPRVRTPIQLPEFAPRVSAPEKKSRLWPWILGVFAMAGATAAIFYLRGHQPAPAVALPPPVQEVIPVAEPPPPPVVEPVKPKPPRRKPKVVKAVIKPRLKPEPPAEAPAEPEPPAVMPGMAVAPAPIPEPAAPPETEEKAAVDLWRGKEQDAINFVLKYKISKGKRTIGELAQETLQGMHDRELIHAADTGERLFLPDKMGWSALREEGPRFRVYLNFMAWQLNGERVQGRSDAFLVDLQRQTLAPADETTRKNFFEAAAAGPYPVNVKAGDIESVLSAVDGLNRHKMRSVIMKSGKLSKEEQQSFQVSVDAAEKKFQKTLVYFRTKYAEKTLQNIARAYGFTPLMKGK